VLQRSGSLKRPTSLRGFPPPGIRETKAIAKEGFIYGLPLVMAYGAMNVLGGRDTFPTCRNARVELRGAPSRETYDKLTSIEQPTHSATPATDK
jgi:hypothetical protein